MIKAEPELARKYQRVVIIQLTVTALVTLLLLFYMGKWAAVSAIYGGLISIAAAFFLRSGVARAANLAKEDPGKSMMSLYIGAVQRFVAVVAMFALGMAIFKLEPLLLLIGFAGAQAGYLLASRTQ